MAALKSHAFYLLHVHLKQGYDLAAKDTNGLSDPYVKFFVRGVNKGGRKPTSITIWNWKFQLKHLSLSH